MAEDRITKLRAIAEQDPNDELTHFSLGTALLDAGESADAAKALQRVIAINAKNSKAYQLLATAQQQAGDGQYAVETLRTGYRVAHRNGDLMPKNAMADMLKELGESLPQVAEKKPAASASAGAATATAGFACSRCGSPGPQLPKRPFKGPMGEKVLARVCTSCWQEWIGMGTKVINELRLPMHDPKAQEMFDQHMAEFLSLEE
ncbi:MAG: Fe(2+)-trafficking protein [Phycisphaerae bacterium]